MALKKGKICLITPEECGSIGEAFGQSAEYLAQEGHEVTLLYAGSLSSIITDLKGKGIVCIPLIEAIGLLPNNVELSYAVYQWLKDKPFDVIHFQDTQGLAYQSLKAKHQGIAFAQSILCVYLHGLTPFEYLSPSSGAYIAHIATLFQEKKSIPLADCVISRDSDRLEECSQKLKWVLPENTAELNTIWSEIHQVLIPLAQKGESPNTSLSLPLVSVCLTHFNRPHYLKQAIASLEQQDYPNFEVVLVDDGSKEPEALTYLDSLETEFKAKGWSIIRQENQYLGVARNNAARHAKGEYLKFMDDDNISKPNEISRFVQVALNTNADIVTCCVKPFSCSSPDEAQSESVWVPFGADASLGVLVNSFGDANALVKKSSFEALGGFTEDYGIGHEDWEFFAKAHLVGYKIELIPETLFYYRVAPGSMQQTTSTWQNLRRNIRPYLARYPELSTLLQFSQGLFEHGKALEQEKQSLKDELSALRHALEVSQEKNRELLNSTSWKVTEPMRKVIASIKS